MKNEEKTLKINQESMDVLVANIIPTSKYFEVRFDNLEQKFDHKFEYMQLQIDELKNGQKAMKEDMDQRFEQVDKRFEQVDKRFEQVDKRFEQVDKRFEQVDKRFEQVDKRFEQVDKRFEQVDENFKEINQNILDLTVQIQKLAKSNETTVRDYIIERDRHYDSKFNNMRNFNLAVITLVAGVVLKMSGIINI